MNGWMVVVCCLGLEYVHNYFAPLVSLWQLGRSLKPWLNSDRSVYGDHDSKRAVYHEAGNTVEE